MSFIRKKKVKGHEYAMEVENYRVNGKVRQRILRYMGRADAEKPIIPGSVFKTVIVKVMKTGQASVYIGRTRIGKPVSIEFRWRDP